MWIWLMPRSSRGDLDAIVSKARRHGIENVVVKGGNGTAKLRQFSGRLVSRLRAGGLRVCAYQFVFGRRPATEARVGARLARMADCLVIDAETAYEGRYWHAQRYMRRLRARIGPDYPVGLTSFPFVHYHPAFPYSVFLGPGGAQFNLPQMYWRAIGVSVDRVFSTTYRWNRAYGRPILPLGQTFWHPPRREIRRFRLLASLNGATGVGWWAWQHSIPRDWRAVGSLLTVPGVLLPPRYPVLARGARGDVVVWAQQHLLRAGFVGRVDGVFGRRMQAAVRRFQLANLLIPTGRIGAATWPALLAGGPGPVTWRRGRRTAAAAGATQPLPRSARLPAVENELERRGGR
jgi:Putative peptidoglycan binding domain